MTRPLPLPLPFGEAQRLRIGLEASRDRLSGRPGALLEAYEDWVAAVALSTTPSGRTGNDAVDVAAKAALGRYGIVLTFPEDRKRAALLHAGALLAGQGKPDPAVEQRVRWLMSMAAGARLCEESLSETLYDHIRPLLPDGLSLLPHQKLALFETSDRNWRCVVNDDLGLGKTVEVLTSLLSWQAEGKGSPFPLLVATQTSIVGAWVEHARKWLHRLGPVVATDFETKGANVVVVPYTQLLSAWREAKAFDPVTVVFDESHYLKNVESQRTKGAILASTNARSVMCVTATLEPNGRPEEAFLQLKLVDRTIEWKDYRYRFCGGFKMSIGGDRKVWNTKGATNPVEFAALLEKMSFRRTKAELGASLGLPDLTRYVLPVDLGPRAQTELERLRREVKASLKEKADLVREAGKKGAEEAALRIEEAEVFAATTKLRMAVGRHKIPAAVSRTKDLVADGHRVVLFCYHEEVARLLHEKLVNEIGKDEGDVLLGTADLDTFERTDLVLRAETSAKAIVLTYAYCEGITLVAFDQGLVVERHWVPDKERQAEGRIHRIGQISDVAWGYLVCRGTIDEAMAEVHVLKETRSTSVVASTAVRVWQGVVEDREP